MPFCPECRSEYRQGFTTCGHCKVKLVDAIPTMPSGGDEEAYFSGKPTEMVTQGALAACKEIRDFMEGKGVMARIVPVSVDDDTPNTHQLFRLEIIKDDLDKARKVLGDRWQAVVEAEGVGATLESREAVLAEGSETECPACQTRFKPSSVSSAECPECGLFLGVPA